MNDVSGRKSLSVESVLRCAIVKQHLDLSYEELSFTLLNFSRVKHSLGCQMVLFPKNQRFKVPSVEYKIQPGNVSTGHCWVTPKKVVLKKALCCALIAPLLKHRRRTQIQINIRILLCPYAL
ncbi:MAG: hypothetical protein V3U75_02790 [Methylococcaceae bacterium]